AYGMLRGSWLVGRRLCSSGRCDDTGFFDLWRLVPAPACTQLATAALDAIACLGLGRRAGHHAAAGMERPPQRTTHPPGTDSRHTTLADTECRDQCGLHGVMHHSDFVATHARQSCLLCNHAGHAVLSGTAPGHHPDHGTVCVVPILGT